jgi:hypothetical protein
MDDGESFRKSNCIHLDRFVYEYCAWRIEEISSTMRAIATKSVMSQTFVARVEGSSAGDALTENDGGRTQGLNRVAFGGFGFQERRRGELEQLSRLHRAAR